LIAPPLAAVEADEVAVDVVPPPALEDDPELLQAAAVRPTTVNARAETTFLRSVLVMVIAFSPLVSCRNPTS
jgi:hypothetical protein